MALGDYSPTAWVNGTSPAISASNLLNIENKVDELDNYAGNDRGILSLTVTSANVTLSAAQALNDVIICSGTLTGNRSVIIPAGIKKQYRIVIKNTANYYIRFITASTGAYFDAYGLISTNETDIQSSYSFDIVTDGTDVYGTIWKIRGSNSNGSYERMSDCKLSCSYTLSTSCTTSTAYGSLYYGTPTISSWTFPYQFNVTPNVSNGYNTNGSGFVKYTPSTTSVSSIVVTNGTNATVSVIIYFNAIGTWK